ncbi:hypothetical protein KR009_012056, partial [Drosophila setifemur]
SGLKMLYLKCIFLLVCLLPGYLEAAKILALFPIPSPSHYFYALPYLKKLASLGHEITSINPFPSKELVENIRDIPLPEVFDNIEELIIILSTPMSTWQAAETANEYGLNLTKKVLNNDAVRREILKPGKAQFDLLIVDLWRSDAIYGLAAYFYAPIIGMAPYGTDWKIDELVGNTSPLSYIQSPSSALSLPDTKSFVGRFNGFVEQSISWINWSWRYKAIDETLYRKYFSNLADQHPLSEIVRNFALVFVNQHFTLTPPRPYVPNMIEVGGLHIDQNPKALPKELEDFVQGSGEYGVIYFSLGSNVRASTLSKDRLKVLLETFAGLPQRVLWKYDDDELPEKPANVFISQWFQQQAVLAHPKVKLFISHGGMLSTIESIHHGTPILGLPFFFDQFRNMEYIQRQGLGLVLNFNEMTAKELKTTIHRLLTEKSFGSRVRKTAALYRDQPMNPMETAIWWTHYILRHKGARHMRVAGRELDFITYHNLDILGTLLAALLVILGVAFFCILKLVKYLCGGGKQIQKQKLR